MSRFFFGLDLWVIAAPVILLVAGSVMLGYWLGRRGRGKEWRSFNARR